MVVEVHTPESTKKQLKEVFKCHDVNGDGKLSRKEIKQAFKDLRLGGRLWRAWGAWRALSQADKDKDGYVSITNQELDDLVDYAYKHGYMHDELRNSA